MDGHNSSLHKVKEKKIAYIPCPKQSYKINSIALIWEWNTTWYLKETTANWKQINGKFSGYYIGLIIEKSEQSRLS
jgi:hypothetical protein